MELLVIFGLLIVLALIIFEFTQTDEGTAKAIRRFGAVRKMVMVWEGYRFDGSEQGTKKWDVVKSKSVTDEFVTLLIGRLIGGLRFVGIRWIDRVYKYQFRWQDLELSEGGEEKKFHDKNISYILIKYATYSTGIRSAETGRGTDETLPERIPVDADFLITLRVKNPYKALFVAPPNWLENVLARLNALFRGWVGTKTVDELITLRGKEEEKKKRLWEEFKVDPLILHFKKDWGIELAENGIELQVLGLPKDYQEAAARRRQMELEAKGAVAATTGFIIESMANARGRTPEEIRKEIDEDEKRQENHLAKTTDILLRDMSLKKGALAHVIVEGAEGLEKAGLNLLTALKKVSPAQAASPANKSDVRTAQMGGRSIELSDDEARRAVQ